MGDVDHAKLEKLIADFGESGGGEMANAQLFVERLTGALGVEQPSPAKEETRLNDYVFERSVTFRHTGGTTSTGRIDCYKRDCFIWEAKQSAKREKARASEQLEMAGMEAPQKLGHAKRGTKSWDKVMIAAKKQAEDYARALPDDHAYPPFLLVADIGNVIEVYADFSGQGRNYAHFPDRQTYRLSMDDLLDEEVQARLRAIWTDPNSLDPTRISAVVTQDVAERLAKITKSLERKGQHSPKTIAAFLMRCLFTMFAEDVRLIPPKRGEEQKPFEAMLKRMIDAPDAFPQALESLWRTMDTGGFHSGLEETLRKFNGELFRDCRALPLDPDEIRELWLAARREWRDVEPAIFGTLLERALETKERGQLGAHFTPRVYVERLVIPTIIDPLRNDWDEVKSFIEDRLRQDDERGALRAAQEFHRQLCSTRVLDPACGTGNFLYVSFELMKKLEGEVLVAIENLGGSPSKISDHPEYWTSGKRAQRAEGRFTVDPGQFFGLEINPRAVPIADLVLWIGYLKWQIRTLGGASEISEPILDAYGTIKEQDAILAYDKQELLRNDDGTPMTRWDGETMKLHPITGEKIPDPDAQVELYTYENPRRANWPEVEFIVGNPPFIGGKDMRAELGDGYAEAAWKARKGVPGGADFVMHFWDEAATRLLAKPPATAKGENPLRRFGFITTNSITQTFSRRVVEKHMNAKLPLSLVYAVPDHPWVKGSERAAVRIAMTVAVRGERQGKLAEVMHESGLNSDTPDVRLESEEGKITSALRLGADFSRISDLIANEKIGNKGIVLHGKGFLVDEATANRLEGRSDKTNDRIIRPLFNGNDLTQRSRGVWAIDAAFLEKAELERNYPKIYQHLYDHVRPERLQNKREVRRLNWWKFGEIGATFRPDLVRIPAYIATTRTAKHRTFSKVSSFVIPESKLVTFMTDSDQILALLSSRLHHTFALTTGGFLEDRPTYQHTDTFNPFPFPIITDTQSTTLDALGERLDAFRKERLAEHDFLTMTDMYNVLERQRELEAGADVEPLSDKEKDIHEAGLISVLKDIHDEIDREVFAAYGWEDLGKRLVGKPGATTPSPHKSEDQEQAEEELLTRLVALNQERAAEEKRGLVRWLRPDFQIPRLGHKVSGSEQVEADLGEAVLIEERKWPSDGLEQIRTVRDVLAEAEAPLPADALATLFRGRTTAKRKARVSEVLETLVATGAARDGDSGYFLPR